MAPRTDLERAEAQIAHLLFIVQEQAEHITLLRAQLVRLRLPPGASTTWEQDEADDGAVIPRHR